MAFRHIEQSNFRHLDGKGGLRWLSVILNKVISDICFAAFALLHGSMFSLLHTGQRIVSSLFLLTTED